MPYHLAMAPYSTVVYKYTLLFGFRQSFFLFPTICFCAKKKPRLSTEACEAPPGFEPGIEVLQFPICIFNVCNRLKYTIFFFNLNVYIKGRFSYLYSSESAISRQKISVVVGKNSRQDFISLRPFSLPFVLIIFLIRNIL